MSPIGWIRFTIVCGTLSFSALGRTGKTEQTPQPSPLDRYIAESEANAPGPTAFTPLPGSLWSPASRLSDLAADVKATQTDDMVTILVVERASALASGTTKSKRSSSAKASVNAIGGLTRLPGPLSDLAQLSGDSSVDGQGSTSRETVLSTTLAARVTRVLHNGYMVVEGAKDIQVNSERQVVTVRGVVRPADLTPDNVIRSDRLVQLEVRISGRGVVGDAIRRPNLLYRILLGILPF